MFKKIILKRLLVAILLGCITISTVTGHYNYAREVKAVAVIDDLAVIIAILAAFGITYVGIQSLRDPLDSPSYYPDDVIKDLEDHWRDLGAHDFDDDLDDYMKENGWMGEDGELTDEWFSHLDSLGYNIDRSTTGGDDNNDDDSGSELWKSIKQMITSDVPASLAVGSTLTCILGFAVKNFMHEVNEGDFVRDPSEVLITTDELDMISSNLKLYPYYIMALQNGILKIQFFSYMPIMFYDLSYYSEEIYNQTHQYVKVYTSYNYIGYNDVKFKTRSYYDKVLNNEYESYGFQGSRRTTFEWRYLITRFNVDFQKANSKFLSTNIHICETTNYSTALNEYKNLITNNELDSPISTAPVNTSNIGNSSAVKNDISNGVYNTVAPTINIPDYSLINKFLEDINSENDDDKKQILIDEFIHDVNFPDNNSDDDPVINPDDDPVINPDDNPDIPSIDGADQIDKSKFLLPEAIKEKFPFCVPFDIIRAFSVLSSSDRNAPYFEIPIKSESFKIDYTFVIDLSIFDDVASLLRTMEIIGFIVTLAFSSRNLIRG